MNKLIFPCKLFTILASGKDRKTMLCLKGGQYDVGAKVMEFVLYLPYASKPQCVEEVHCTCRQEHEGQRSSAFGTPVGNRCSKAPLAIMQCSISAQSKGG